MSRGMLKAVGAAAFVVVVAAALLLLTFRAQAAGRLTYCRNNLHHLGVFAHGRFAANYDSLDGLTGRAFWQMIRESRDQDPRTKKWRTPPLNPYGCPVRGVAPLDLGTLSPESLAAYMSDPKTIDYRGPSGFPDAPSRMILGADLEGNHPEGGHVLLADFSVLTKDAITVDGEWTKAASTKD